MKKILLVSPDYNPEERQDAASGSGSSEEPSSDVSFLQTKALFMPLGMATVAALTPDDVEVDIWHEGIREQITEDTDLGKAYDLVAVTGYGAHISRVREIGRIFRARGVLVAVGGPGVSAAPEYYRDQFDVVFIGEAEYTWPKFIADWKSGVYKSEYRQVSKVDMADSPLPCWDKVASDAKRYVMGAVQTTRGCPFDCEFCDVIYIFGRQARHKPVAQVLEEVRRLEQLGVEYIFFSDDNFIGNPRYAKELLRELVPLNRSFNSPIGFYTQATLNVAKDEELLELMADANFFGMFVGIESTNVDSLIETNKPQNYRTNILEDVKKIHSYGLLVVGGMIVGFDNDDQSVFDRQFEFIQAAGILRPRINILMAPVGTKLWVRLRREGRLLDLPTDQEQPEGFGMFTRSNILPKQMTRVELLTGYRDLLEKVLDWSNFEERVKELLSQVQRRPVIKRWRPPWKLALGFFRFALFSMNGKERSTIFRLLVHTLRRSPFMMKQVLGASVLHFMEARRLPSLVASLNEQIRWEEAEGMNLQLLQATLMVPDGFKKPYKAIFPELHDRVFRSLADQTRTHEALVEIVYDFLTRWGPSFQEFEEHHQTFLNEICDRTLAGMNSEAPSADADAIPGKADVPADMRDLTPGQVSIKLSRLADDVLHSVEQDLRAVRPEVGEFELEPTVGR